MIDTLHVRKELHSLPSPADSLKMQTSKWMISVQLCHVAAVGLHVAIHQQRFGRDTICGYYIYIYTYICALLYGRCPLESLQSPSSRVPATCMFMLSPHFHCSYSSCSLPMIILVLQPLLVLRIEKHPDEICEHMCLCLEYRRSGSGRGSPANRQVIST